MSNPTVSILLAVFNGRAGLPRALRSIQAQTWQDMDIVAIDDGSTDGSGEYLEEVARSEPRLRVFRQGNQGLGPALARAAREARGELLARHDADDISAPGRIAKQVEYFSTHPRAALCGTGTWLVHPKEGPLFSYVHPDDPPLILRTLEEGGNPIFHGTAMFKAGLYRSSQGYRFRKYCEDLDLWLQLAGHGQVGSIESVEYFYQLSSGGMSNRFRSARPQLQKLTLTLHSERQRTGRELTPWKEREAAILAEVPPDSTAADVDSYQAYYLGMHALRLGDSHSYRRYMREAAARGGDFSRKARWHQRLSWASPLVRCLYAAAEQRGVSRFIRPLPRGTVLPDFSAND